MMKFNLPTAAVAFSVFAQSIFAGDITFFDASKNIGVPKGKNIVNHPDSIELTSTKQIEFKGEWDLSKNLDFEKAAAVRDKLAELKSRVLGAANPTET